MGRTCPRCAMNNAALRTLLAAALGLALGRAAAADEQQRWDAHPTGRAAQRFYDAFRAGDDAAMRAAAEDRAIGLHVVADAFLARHATGALAEPPVTGDYLDAAAALAERAAKDARGLPAVVRAWRGFDRERFERDRRLRAVLRSLPEAKAPGAADATVKLVEAVTADLAAGEGHVVSVVLNGRLGAALLALGRKEDALAAYRRSAAFAEAVRWPTSKSATLRQIAAVEAARKRPADAAAAYAEALELIDEFGGWTAKTVAAMRTELAVNLVEANRAADALPVAEQALAEQTALGDAAGMARVLIPLGAIRRVFGRHREALDYYERAIATYESIAERRGATYARLQAAVMQHRLKDLATARRAFERVETDADALGLESLSVEAALGLGRLLWDEGRQAEAASANQRAVERAAKAGLVREEANGWKQVARDRAVTGDWPGTLEGRRRAVELLETLGQRAGSLASDYRELGAAYEAVRDHAQAIEAYRKSVAGLRGRSRRHGDEYGARDQVELRMAADQGGVAALRLAYAEPRELARAVADAFFFAEASRATLLADALAGRAGPPESSELAAARARAEAARRHVLLTAFGGAADPEVLTAAKRAHDEAGTVLRDLLARADLERRRLAPPPSAEPVSLDQARAALPPDALLVVYQQDVTRAWAVAITRSRYQILDLGDARRYAGAAKAWGEALTTPDGDEGTHAETLYDALLAPLEPLLPEGGTLLVSPDGPLMHLPFEAMVRRRDGVTQRAIERWTISYVPSATVHTAIERERAAARPGEALVALGDPVYPTEGLRIDRDQLVARLRGLTSLERLPASGDEVRDVAALFPADRRTVLVREEATRARLTNALQASRERLRALHLACHGFADPTDPTQTGLVLADADVLTVGDVARMRVPADLVVLSACESGRGVLRRGEGILGFVRAFLTAGATRVLVADRRVADEDARVLVRDFYQRHLVDGLAPAAALRAAKLARLAAGGAAAHPYAWSALVLWE
jgi:CHAT domain-containing protein